MTLRIGIISVQDTHYHPNRRLLEAAARGGYLCELIHPYRLWPKIDNGTFRITGRTNAPLPDVILPRQGAEIKDSCLALIRHLEWMGTAVINGADAVAIARNKFLSQQVLNRAGIPCPDTIFVNDAAGFFQAVKDLGGYPVVVKPISGRQGAQILRVTDDNDVRQRAVPALDARQGIMVQRYVDPDMRQDIRSLIVGGRVVGAVSQVPAKGDFRANFHLGATIQPVNLSDALAQLSIHAAKAIGCDVAGIDIMVEKNGRPAIVEVNYAPGFRGMEAASGRDIARRIIDFAVDRYRQIKKDSGRWFGGSD